LGVASLGGVAVVYVVEGMVEGDKLEKKNVKVFLSSLSYI